MALGAPHECRQRVEEKRERGQRFEEKRERGQRVEEKRERGQRVEGKRERALVLKISTEAAPCDEPRPSPSLHAQSFLAEHLNGLLGSRVDSSNPPVAAYSYAAPGYGASGYASACASPVRQVRGGGGAGRPVGRSQQLVAGSKKWFAAAFAVDSAGLGGVGE